MSFFDHPPELRLHIYEYILDSAHLPIPKTLHEYSGFLLSSRSSYAEVQFEAMKRLKQFIDDIHAQWPSDAPPPQIPYPTSFHQAANTDVALPRCSRLSTVNAIYNLLQHLLMHLPRFTLAVSSRNIWHDRPGPSALCSIERRAKRALRRHAVSHPEVHFNRRIVGRKTASADGESFSNEALQIYQVSQPVPERRSVPKCLGRLRQRGLSRFGKSEW